MEAEDGPAVDGIGLGAAAVALVVAILAWVPTLASMGALAYALSDSDGFGCTWKGADKPVGMAAILIAAPAALAATGLAVFALIRGVRSASAVGIGASVAAFVIGLAALPGPFFALFVNAIEDDRLCWYSQMIYGRRLRGRQGTVVAEAVDRAGWGVVLTGVRPGGGDPVRDAVIAAAIPGAAPAPALVDGAIDARAVYDGVRSAATSRFRGDFPA